MTSNTAETINSAVRSVRELPITTLLEALKDMQQRWSMANRDEANSTFTALAKTPHSMMENNYKVATRFYVQKASDAVYKMLADVMPIAGNQTFMSDTTATPRQVNPRDGSAKPGRPRKQRLKSGWEHRSKNRCSKCNEKGHNVKTCRNPIKNEKQIPGDAKFRFSHCQQESTCSVGNRTCQTGPNEQMELETPRKCCSRTRKGLVWTSAFSNGAVLCVGGGRRKMKHSAMADGDWSGPSFEGGHSLFLEDGRLPLDNDGRWRLC
ncbi:gag-pol polyprotein [Striga asiatica]|uniref:Gag-pol polyprotein n=1 Tax=Striga asiatica TaxID=4170 RepID=A0A5A7PFI5_STRAF|nr:gag-pol polyprotein [Striga asiatica]